MARFFLKPIIDMENAHNKIARNIKRNTNTYTKTRLHIGPEYSTDTFEKQLIKKTINSWQ